MSANVQVARERQPESLMSRLYVKRPVIILFLIIFVFAFSVRYVNLMGEGITWDEPVYVHGGIAYVDSLMHLNLTSEAYSFNLEHPPVAKYLYGAAIWAFNGGKEDLNAYVVAKVVSAFLGAAACVLTFFIGWEFFNGRIAFISALILALIPDFVAHTQIAALDGPVAFFFTLTMALFMMALKTKSKGYYIASAVSLGLLIDTKLTGLLILPVMALLFIARRYPGPHDNVAGMIRHYLPLRYILGFIIVAAATAFIIYPWAWGGVGDLKQTLDHWNTPAAAKYFLGSIQQAPLYYYPVYFLVTTPTLLFLPLALGALYILRSRDPYKLGILLWLIVPFAYDFGSFKQDGMRYILMIYPAVALICGAGLEDAAGRIKAMLSGPLENKAIFTILSAMAVVYLIVTLASVSPYYLDYYNVLAGGPANVYEHNFFEFGWWGEGIYESIQYVDHDALPGEPAFVACKPEHLVKIYLDNDDSNAAYSVPKSRLTILFPGSADYVITNTLTDESNLSFDRPGYRLVHMSQVQGAPLAEVYKR